MSVCGLLLGVVSPVLIGYGQRLLPEGQRLASAITMGVSWGIGGLIVSALVGTLNYVGRPLLGAADIRRGGGLFVSPVPGLTTTRARNRLIQRKLARR